MHLPLASEGTFVPMKVGFNVFTRKKLSGAVISEIF